MAFQKSVAGPGSMSVFAWMSISSKTPCAIVTDDTPAWDVARAGRMRTAATSANPAANIAATDLCFIVFFFHFDSFVCEGKHPFFTHQGAKRRKKGTGKKR